jgi:hypothetical protein
MRESGNLQKLKIESIESIEILIESNRIKYSFRWTLDERVYEGVIEKLDLKRQNAAIRFIGYDNLDTVALDQLFASKGEEWREGQRYESEQAEKGPAMGVDGQPPPPDLRLLSAKDCQVANF